jgi:hypothetical protein
VNANSDASCSTQLTHTHANVGPYDAPRRPSDVANSN